jgi:glutamate synthase (NADPH/NADH) large chain
MAGLYRPEFEHDSCGIGFVANIKGAPSHEILTRALEVLERMTHRGAESADNKTGDGSGVLIHIPHDYYKKIVGDVGEPGAYGTGLLFLPQDDEQRAILEQELPHIAQKSGLTIKALRDVPVNNGDIGAMAKVAEPLIKQIFLGLASEGAIESLPIKLYLFRRRLEKYASAQKIFC